MRTTIACERCRRSKVKCHHLGEGPCRGCLRSGNGDTCVLMPTHAVTAPGRSRKSQSSGKRTASLSPLSARKPVNKRSTGPADWSSASDGLASHFASIDAGVFAQAVATFRVQFPECGFIHPSDLERASVHIPDDDKLRLIAILAVSCRYLGESADGRRAEHAALLTRELQCRITAPPTLGLIQCFLIMAIYEWGEGVGYSAWMYAGIAARMAQVHRATKTETSERDATKATAILTEAEIRTMWTYFSIDKLLSCGKQRPAMMKPEDIEVRMPQSEEDFVFGVEPRETVSFEDLLGDRSLRKKTSSPGFHFCTLVRGLDLWHKIHSWIVDGGRKQPRMTEPENCPWKPTSQWAKLKEQLVRWREDHDARLKYPETKVAAHVHFRQGEVFAYINLLYYLCIVFIRREFIPLLPFAEQEPNGPIDPPFYSEEAPAGWWRHNADELFEAAAQISYIMGDLNDLGIALHTPFSGLCVFTAALMNGYAEKFPHMHRLEERGLRRQLAAENLADLEKIARLWRLGEEWVEVIGAAQNMYDRVISTRAQSLSSSSSSSSSTTTTAAATTITTTATTTTAAGTAGGTGGAGGAGGAGAVGRPRPDYSELENSVHYAPLGGLYGDKLEPSRGHRPDTRLSSSQRRRTASRRRAARVVQDRGEAEQAQDGSGQQQPVPDLFAGYGADTTSEDWRLWSFWDDPHLLSWDTSTIGI
ncbi:hypothetical protein GGR50DRAFT_261695 [Xylaria sp. CBS 124048]|nr:hypothetical protein GGR50DRAFT_261695 [Xylaria sp. CBS 124048]